MVGGGQVDRWSAAVTGSGKDIEVGRQWLDPAGFAQRKIDGAGVGRECDLLAATHWLGRRVADEIALDRDAGPCELSGGDGEGK